MRTLSTTHHTPTGRRPRRAFYLLRMAAMLLALLTVVSCGKEAESVDDYNKQTILVYMPWSGNLLSVFKENLDSIESGIIAKGGLNSQRVLVFISEAESKSKLYEITYSDKSKSCSREELKTYEGTDYTTAEGITEVLTDVKRRAEAQNYAMMIGCHGTGWTFKDSWTDYPRRAARRAPAYKLKNERTDLPFEMTTRFFGSVSNLALATDIPTLAEGIANTGIKMQYILFDDCYMANVEVAYELRNVTNFLIASTSEVMAVGMPYSSMWSSLASVTPNYTGAVSAFGTFYNEYIYPYGTVSAIDCRQMDNVAAIMKQINSLYTFDEEQRDELQVLDGFEPAIFYDFGDYVEKLCEDPLLVSKMQDELSTLVRSTVKTEQIYSALPDGGRFFTPEAFSGITISDPSIHPAALKGLKKTSWYEATH